MLMSGGPCVFVPEPAGRNATFSSAVASGSSGKKDKVSVCCGADHHLGIAMVVCIYSLRSSLWRSERFIAMVGVS